MMPSTDGTRRPSVSHAPPKCVLISFSPTTSVSANHRAGRSCYRAATTPSRSRVILSADRETEGNAEGLSWIRDPRSHAVLRIPCMRGRRPACPGGDRHQSIQYLDWDLVEWAGAIAPYVSCGRDLRADVASAS